MRLGPPERSYAIWLNYLLAVERASRDSTRSFVDYGLVLADWRREFTRIRSDLDLEDRLSEVLVEEEIDTFLTKDLRNARAMGPYNESGVVSETLKLLHAGLHQPDELHARFDAVYATFSEARQMFGDLVVELQRKNEALAGHTLRAVPRAVSWRSPSADSPPRARPMKTSVRATRRCWRLIHRSYQPQRRTREGATSVIQKLEAERDALEDVGECGFAPWKSNSQIRCARRKRSGMFLKARLAAQTTDSELERDLLEQRLADKTRTSEVDQGLLGSPTQSVRGKMRSAMPREPRRWSGRYKLNIFFRRRASPSRRASSVKRWSPRSCRCVALGRKAGIRTERLCLPSTMRRARSMAQEREALVQELDTERAILRVSSEALGKTRRELSEVHRALDACAGEVTEARSAAESAQSETAAELERILRSKSWRLTRPIARSAPPLGGARHLTPLATSAQEPASGEATNARARLRGVITPATTSRFIQTSRRPDRTTTSWLMVCGREGRQRLLSVSPLVSPKRVGAPFAISLRSKIIFGICIGL